MKRMNPKTGTNFKFGDIRNDGMVFRTYLNELKEDGFCKEVWHSKETFVKQYRKQQELSKKWKDKRSKERKEYINSIKMGRGCYLCGYADHPSALDFDHIDRKSKKFDISSKFACVSIERLDREIMKCRVVCANCHRAYSFDNGHSRPHSTSFSNKIETMVHDIESSL